MTVRQHVLRVTLGGGEEVPLGGFGFGNVAHGNANCQACPNKLLMSLMYN